MDPILRAKDFSESELHCNMLSMMKLLNWQSKSYAIAISLGRIQASGAILTSNGPKTNMPEFTRAISCSANTVYPLQYLSWQGLLMRTLLGRAVVLH
jgi:hypothetical protein